MLSTILERDAAVARVRAERRCGELLEATDLPDSSPGNQYTGEVDPSIERRGPKTLAQMGISYNQSKQWKDLANVPEKEFEAAVNASVKGSGAIL